MEKTGSAFVNSSPGDNPPESGGQATGRKDACVKPQPEKFNAFGKTSPEKSSGHGRKDAFVKVGHGR